MGVDVLSRVLCSLEGTEVVASKKRPVTKRHVRHNETKVNSLMPYPEFEKSIPSSRLLIGCIIKQVPLTFRCKRVESLYERSELPDLSKA